MKIINFGSLNIDYVYRVKDFVRPGETIHAESRKINAGGKGLNQSLAIARSGHRVIHAGAIGPDGQFLEQLLAEAGADTSRLLRTETGSGHAVIQVSDSGQNAILVYGGANQQLTAEYVDEILTCGEPGDFVLLQNETNLVPEIIQKAHARGLGVAWNPSPFPETLSSYPLDLVNCFIVNETEGALLAQAEDLEPEQLMRRLMERFPRAILVLTCGSGGVLCCCGGTVYRHKAFQVEAVDTTAAGDTFCGYFLAMLCKGVPCLQSLATASAAAALAVTRPGAAPSIPLNREVSEFLEKETADD